MKKILVSFGGKQLGKNRHNFSYNIIRNYSAEVKRLFESAKSYFDGFWEYDNDWIYNSAYYQTDARKVLDCTSFGWAFKPISIFDALSMTDDGDIVMWVDSNDLIIDDPQPVFDLLSQCGIFCHDHYPQIYPCYQWTQTDMFIGMDCNEEKYWNAPQMQVNIMAFSKNSFTMHFIEEWVKYAIDYDIMIQNNVKNMGGFVQHRHEQSIFSILREKYELPFCMGYPYGVAKEEMGICM